MLSVTEPHFQERGESNCVIMDLRHALQSGPARRAARTHHCHLYNAESSKQINGCCDDAVKLH